MCTRIELMELYEAYYNMVYRLSFVMLKNKEDAWLVTCKNKPPSNR